MTTTRPIIIYIGGYPAIPNIGDVALYLSYKKLFPSYKFIHFKGGKFETFLFSLTNKKVIPILAGGTLINHMCLRELKQAVQIWGDFYVLGTGAAQTSYWEKQKNYIEQKDEWSELLKRAKQLGVRGELSVSQLTEQGLSSFVFGDPVFQYATENSSKNGKNIGLNVGKSLGYVQGGEGNLETLFENLAQELKEKGYKITWFVVCPEDMAITQKLAHKIGGDVFADFYNPKKYMSRYKKMNYFIGTKLHAVCFALCESIPSIMIEYRPKCRDLMMSVEMEQYSFSPENLDITKVMGTLRELNDNYDDISKKIKTNILKLKEDQKSFVQKIGKESE